MADTAYMAYMADTTDICVVYDEIVSTCACKMNVTTGKICNKPIKYRYKFSKGEIKYTCGFSYHMDQIISSLDIDENITVYVKYETNTFIESHNIDCFNGVFDSKLFYGPYKEKETYLLELKNSSLKYFKTLYAHRARYSDITSYFAERELVIKLLGLYIIHGEQYNFMLTRVSQLNNIIEKYTSYTSMLDVLQVKYNAAKIKYNTFIQLHLPWRRHCSSKVSLECSICMSDVDESNGGMTECDHVFHNHCLKKWMEVQHSCPNCRKVCNLVDYLVK